MGGHGASPCASCKLLRRRCTKDCIFAPYFPSDDPHKFAIVHKVFGSSNVSKMLQELPKHQRADAVSSLVYEGNARMRDPVYGCVGAISYLQNQVCQLQMQLAVAQAEIVCIKMQKNKEPINMTTPVVHNNNYFQADDDDDISFFLHNNNNLSLQQCLTFVSSSDHHVVMKDSLKRDYLYGHDMIS